MDRPALLNKKGMTLIEIMVALVLLMIVAMATMQTAMVGMNANLQNALRDEAVNIADREMEELRNTPFNSIPLGTVQSQVTGTFRGGIVVPYTSKQTVLGINTSTKEIGMSVSWPFRGHTYTHAITTIVRQPQ